MLSKHQKFAEEYVKDHNATKAAIRAGYAEGRAAPTGSELARRPDVAAYIEELGDQRRENLGITIAGEVERLEQVWRGALEDGSWGAATKIAELRLKLAGLLVERRETISVEAKVFTLGFDRDIIDD